MDAVVELGRLLAPRSIAVVGASDRPGSVGGAVLRNIVAGGYAGILHPVNPNRRSVQRLRAYPSVLSLPVPPGETGSTDQLLSVAAVSSASLYATGYYSSPSSGMYEPLLVERQQLYCSRHSPYFGYRVSRLGEPTGRERVGGHGDLTRRTDRVRRANPDWSLKPW